MTFPLHSNLLIFMAALTLLPTSGSAKEICVTTGNPWVGPRERKCYDPDEVARDYQQRVDSAQNAACLKGNGHDAPARRKRVLDGIGASTQAIQNYNSMVGANKITEAQACEQAKADFIKFGVPGYINDAQTEIGHLEYLKAHPSCEPGANPLRDDPRMHQQRSRALDAEIGIFKSRVNQSQQAVNIFLRNWNCRL